MKKILGDNPVVQIGYYVPDVKQAVLQHSEIFGSGPFFLTENMKSEVIYRGEKLNMDVSAAFGQWGDIQVEFVQQNNAEASYLTETGAYGLHHFAVFVDDMDAAMAEFQAYGCEVSGYEKRQDGSYVTAMIDCKKMYGHCIEMYSAKDISILGLFKAIRGISEGWDGTTDVVRSKLG